MNLPDLRPLALFFIGLTVLAFGIGLMVNAGIGVGPWQVFETGVSRQTGLTVGTVVVLESTFVLLVAVRFLKVNMGVGTVLSALFGGPLVDVFLAVLPMASTSLGVWTMLLFGTAMFSVGLACYLSADLGPTPKDAMFVGLTTRFGFRFGWARFSVDASLMAVGAVLGGQFGVGTGVAVVLVPALSAPLAARMREPAWRGAASATSDEPT